MAAVIVALAVAWRFVPFTPEELLLHARAVRELPLAPLWVAAAYVLLGLVMFPFVALRLGTVLVFGPILGPIYALAAGTLSAFVGYSIGRRLGAGALERSPRAEKIRARLAGRGVLAVAALRLVPLGPFTLVNAMAGAARVPRRDFVLGTALGTAPGLLVLAMAGASLAHLV